MRIMKLTTNLKEERKVDKVISFRKFTEFPRGTMYDILQDAYSFDSRNKEIWDENWHESDDFFMIIQVLQICMDS